MVSKNILAIRTLLSMAYENGNSLNESWSHVFQCISRLVIFLFFLKKKKTFS